VLRDCGEERLLGRQQLVVAPSHDGNRAVRAVGLAGEVLVGLQAAEDAQHVRPRPLLARRGGPGS
jgi:hypothetical protein